MKDKVKLIWVGAGSGGISTEKTITRDEGAAIGIKDGHDPVNSEERV